MAKGDYFFPLYYQKLLASTQGWKDDEVGAYIRLLIYQYDKGFIPDDMNIIIRIAPSVKRNWPVLSTKFKKDESGNLVNEVMKEIRDRRLKKGSVNAENGKKGGRPKTQKETENNPNGYLKKSNNNMVNVLMDSDLKEVGPGEENFLHVVPNMLQAFKIRFPRYLADQEKDYPALTSIAEKIMKWHGLEGWPNEHSDKIQNQWNEVADHLKGDNFLSKYSISQVDKNFQSVIQSMTNGAHKQTSTDGVKLGTGAARIEALKKW